MEDTKNFRAKSRGGLLQILKACALWDALDDFISGTGEPAAGMEEVVEFATQHMGFSDQNLACASSKVLPRMENRVPYCTHECAYHAAWMRPAIWSGLPEELLQLVFGRLPLADTIRLQCLSKQWNRIVNSHDFKQVCADAHPKLFAIISRSSFSGTFQANLFDLRSDAWHAMEIDTGYRERFRSMNACDGGLVCFACTSAKPGESIPVPVLVCNPLTRAVRALPLHSHNKRPPQMLQLVMDRITKCYQVLIVSTDQNEGRLVAELFHSNTGAWTTTNLSDFKYFSGHQYSWYDDPEGRFYRCSNSAPCVYECAEGRFLETPAVADLLRDEPRNGVKQCSLVQDRLFVLREKEREATEGAGFPEHFIAEFQGLESDGANWLKLKDHRCSNLGYAINYTRFLACKSFLLVVVYRYRSPFEHGSLYDLSTGKWHALSPGFLGISSKDMMCELQWDAVP